MQGTADCMLAIAHAARIGAAQARWQQVLPVAATASDSPAARIAVSGVAPTPAANAIVSVCSAAHAASGDAAPSALTVANTAAGRMLNEAAAKQALHAFGLPIPQGLCVAAHAAADAAQRLGFPVVVKAVSDTLAHKTEAGGVQLNLRTASEVQAAVAAMAHLASEFLVEHMARDVVAEIIVGISRDAQFGLALTLGAGGVLVELLQDTATLLLPVSRGDIHTALQGLKTWPLLTGYRGKASGDVEALIDAVAAIAAYARAHADCLLELDVNPILVLPTGSGVLAVDALIHLLPDTAP
jgi:acetyl-CoA synthetase